MARERLVNRSYATDRLRLSDAHVGLYDVHMRRIWIARRRRTLDSAQVSHARLIRGGTQASSTAEKDRFLCFWFHPPHTLEGAIQGRRLDERCGHVIVRLDPYWDHVNQRFLSATETAYVRRNLDMQHRWGQRVFHAYLEQQPPFALTWHALAPRPEDSMFDIQCAAHIDP